MNVVFISTEARAKASNHKRGEYTSPQEACAYREGFVSGFEGQDLFSCDLISMSEWPNAFFAGFWDGIAAKDDVPKEGIV